MYEDDCPKCGVTDYGWELPDVRSTLYVSNCRCKSECACTAEDREGAELGDDECVCAECGCECDRTTIQIRIKRVWDQQCGYCNGADWRPLWEVVKDGRVVCTVPSEASADAVVGVEFPDAEPPEPDYAWESERWLRRAEGWGY